MKRVACIAFLVILLSAVPAAPQRRDAAPRQGAAEKPDAPWPYPEPAVRGATGYLPDYARFAAPDERKDIQTFLLWRATAPTARPDDRRYYLDEYGRFMTEAKGERPEVIAQSMKDFVRLVGDPIRKGARKPPFFDDKFSGCWIFFVSRPSPVIASRQRTRDLHAGNCR
jgi:hypothetical protein